MLHLLKLYIQLMTSKVVLLLIEAQGSLPTTTPSQRLTATTQKGRDQREKSEYGKVGYLLNRSRKTKT